MPRHKGNPNWSNGTYNLLPEALPGPCAWEKMLAAEGLQDDDAALEELTIRKGEREKKLRRWVDANRDRFIPLAVLAALGITEEMDVVGW